MKIKFVLILLVSLTFLLSYTEAFSCPVGYTSVTKVVTVGDCDYSVDICVKCPTGPVPGKITFTSFTLTNPSCNNSLDINQVFDGIKLAISNFTFIQDLCVQLQAPPCNQAQLITFYWYNCWYEEKINYFEEDHIVYRACDYDTYCEVVKRYCWNGNIFVDYTDSVTQHGEPNRPIIYYPDPTEYNQPTPCMRLHTECDDL
jgi:hypothetical protein